MEYRQEREAVLAAARRTVASGLTHGTAGNVSMRIPPGMLITPTGLEYERLTPEEVVATGLDGVPLPGERWAPSSEWPLHAAVYAARPEIGAVVHGHAPAAEVHRRVRPVGGVMHRALEVLQPRKVRPVG